MHRTVDLTLGPVAGAGSMNAEDEGMRSGQDSQERALVEDGSAPESTVLVVDDHRSFAEMLSAALDSVAGLTCIGIAQSAAEGVALAWRLQAEVDGYDMQK